MIFALKPTFIPIENESHFWITPRRGVSRCFLKQLEMVSHKWSQFPYFFSLYNNFASQLDEQTSKSQAIMDVPTLSQTSY